MSLNFVGTLWQSEVCAMRGVEIPSCCRHEMDGLCYLFFMVSLVLGGNWSGRAVLGGEGILCTIAVPMYITMLTSHSGQDFIIFHPSTSMIVRGTCGLPTFLYHYCNVSLIRFEFLPIDRCFRSGVGFRIPKCNLCPWGARVSFWTGNPSIAIHPAGKPKWMTLWQW